MTQPTPYRRGYDFSDAGGATPPGGPLDGELDDVGLTLSQVLRNLALIQRDDTALRNGIVGIDALDNRVLGLLSGGTFTIAGTWATATSYAAGAFFSDDEAIYLTMEAHTSVSIVDDLAAGHIVKVLQNEQGERLRDDSTGDGVTTVYTLSQSPARPADVEVYVEGLLVPADEYAQTGATVTFDVAPANGDKISIFSIVWSTAPPIQTLVDAVGDRNTEISAATDFLQDASDNGGVMFLDTAAASGGAAMLGTASGRTLDVVLADSIKLLDYAEGDGTTDDRAGIIAAIQAADTGGKLLVWAARNYRISSPITGLTIGQINWLCEGATITLDAGADALVAFQATLAVGVDHRITGSGLHLDCNGRTHLGMRFLQPLADRTATFHAEGLSVTDTEMQVGAGEASGGVVVRGGYKKVTLVEPRASEIKMRTGAGTIGTNGITGILVMSSTLSGCYPLDTEIIRPVVDHVYSLDATYQYDMDGIGIFANPATQNAGGFSTARIIDPTISRCWGRDVKMQVGWALVSNPRSTISQGPTGGIINAAYDFQVGSGQLIGGDYTIDGVTHTAGLCRFSCIAETSPMSSRWDGGTITVKGGATVHRLAVHDTMVAERALSTFSGQSVRGTIREFAWLRSNGLDIDTVRCEGQAIEDITEALCRIESGSYGSAPRRGRLYARDVQHLGAGSPSLVKGNIGGLAANVLCSSESCDGFADPPTAISMTAGTQSAGKMLSQIWAEPPAGEEAIGAGSQRLLSKFMEDAEEWTLPAHGFNSGACIALVSLGVNHTTQALVFTGSGINGIAIGSATQVAASSDPGSGSLRIWRNSNSLVIKNSSGSSRSCNVLLFG